MTEKRKRVIKNTIIVLLWLVVARLIRVIDFPVKYQGGFGFFCIFSIYVFLLTSWGISIQKRISDRHIRFYLLLSAGAMIFWFTVRSMHHSGLGYYETAIRYAWYLYYLAMLAIVQSAFYLSLYIGKKEDNGLDFKWHITTVISGLLFLGILTNEYHELAFGVHEGTTHATHGPVFFATAIWIVFLAVTSVGRICYNCYETGFRRKIIYVCIPFAVAAVYFVSYFIKGRSLLLEITAAYCCLTIAIWESLIQTGMIPSNNDYDWCIRHSSIHAAVLNNRGDVVYSSRNVYPLDEETVSTLWQEGTMMASADTELHMDKISGGFVVWEKNVKEENLLLNELEIQKENLVDANRILGGNIVSEGRHQQLQARNRLYDLVISRIDLQIDELRERLELLKNADDMQFANILGEINIIGVYVKRKSNLILVEELNPTDMGRELKMCFKETFDTLQRAGIDADFHFREVPVINIDIALILYDFLESVIDHSMGSLQRIFTIVTAGRSEIAIVVSVVLNENMTETDEELWNAFEGWHRIVSDYYGGGLDIENSGEEFSMRLSVLKGGGSDV